MVVPSAVSGCGGVTTRRECQEPARVFRLSKDFWAPDWAETTVESNRLATANSVKRRNFMFPAPYACFYFRVQVVPRSDTKFNSASLSVVVDYTTISHVKVFFQGC